MAVGHHLELLRAKSNQLYVQFYAQNKSSLMSEQMKFSVDTQTIQNL